MGTMPEELLSLAGAVEAGGLLDLGGTPLMAAESTTMAKPTCSQMRTMMSRNVLSR